MANPPDDFQPTEADLDLVVEEATGKPTKPDSLEAGIASLRQRITQFEQEKASLLDRLDDASGVREAALVNALAALAKDLAAARERLAQFEAQLGMRN